MGNLKNIKYYLVVMALFIFTNNIAQARTIKIMNNTNHNIHSDIELQHSSNGSLSDSQIWYEKITSLKQGASISFPGASLGDSTDYWNLSFRYDNTILGNTYKEYTGWFECSIPNGTSTLTFYIDSFPETPDHKGDVHLDSDGSGKCDTAIYAKLL